MPINTKVQDLKINVLTEAQFDAAVQSGVIGDYELSVLTDIVDKSIQVSTMPIASAEEAGNIYQYVGTTDANYTNGYFYKCVGSENEIAEVLVLPAASAQEAGNTYKYVGETNSTYTNNKYYKCTSDGLLIDDWSNTEYETFSWKEVLTDTTGITTVSELPEASAQEEGNIYKQGDKYYKCTSYLMAADWDQPDITAYKWSELETMDASNDAYSWVRINVQPDQTIVYPVTSVNGETGAVVLSASDVGAATAAQGAKADTAVQPGDLAAVATSGDYSDLSNTPTIGNAVLTIQKNGTAVDTFSANATSDKTINIEVPVDASDVGALPDSTKYVANASMTIDSSTYIITLQLKDQDGSNIGTAQTIDLPLESVVVSGSYDNVNKKIVLTLKDGSTIDIPVADLVAGLQSEITSSNKLDADLVDDSTSVNKFVTAAEKTAWNGKQDAISDLATIRSNASDGASAYTTISGYGDIVTHDADEFASASQGAKADTAVQPGDLAAVATSGSYNDLINKPTIGAGVLTIQKNGTAVDTFSANASENKVINITVPVDAADVNALPDSTKYAANASLTIDSSTFVITLQLKDQDGANLGTAQTIDLPLESVVVSGSYDNTNKKIVLTLKDGSTIDIPVADLVAGLQSEITSENKLDADLVDDTNSVHKFVTAAEKTAWNDKAEVVFREWNEGE